MSLAMDEPTPVATIAPQHLQTHAPAPLRDLQGWLIWRYEHVPGETKARKVPYYADGRKRVGRQGSPEDRAKLVTFDAARAAASRRGFDGLGLAMLPDWGLTALDFDNVVGPDGKLPDEVREIVTRTYAEFSPSGSGIRAFVRGALGDRKSRNGPGGYGLEIFSGSGYVTVTGNMLDTTEFLGLQDTVANAGPRVRQLCDARFGPREPDTGSPDHDPFAAHEPRLGLSLDEMAKLLADLDPSMGREDWIRVGMALHHETGGEAGFDLWDQWSSGGYQYPGTESLQTQWDSFTRREGSGRRPVTMATVVRMAHQARERRQKLLASTGEEHVLRPDEAVEALQKAVDAAERGEVTTRFHFERAVDYAQRPAPTWLIKGVLPRATLGVLYGSSGSGKSFVALDMAAAICRALDWRGQRTASARVGVIAAEGGGGYASRIKAYGQHHDVDLGALPLFVMNAAPNFLLRDDASDVAAAMTAAQGLDLLIVDTFAQVTPGANENAAEDMGRALAHAKAIHEATGAMVLLVHHAGKDTSKGARGWSGIKAAADVEIEVVRQENDRRYIRVTKQKDGRDGLAWGFKLEDVLLGFDDDGDEITSCVVLEDEMPPPPEPRDKSRGKAQDPWETLIMDAIDDIPKSVLVMLLEDFVALCEARLPPPTGDYRDNRANIIVRTVTKMSKFSQPPLLLEHGCVRFLTP